MWNRPGAIAVLRWTGIALIVPPMSVAYDTRTVPKVYDREEEARRWIRESTALIRWPSNQSAGLGRQSRNPIVDLL
jgi:hypothetical protein